MKYIKLSNGEFTKVDDDIYDVQSNYKWHKSHEYVARTLNGKTLFLHRLIMGTPEGLHTDHVNHDKLDNRRENLRICTNQENQMNRNAHNVYANIPTTSKYKGVSWDKTLCLWRSYIKVNDKNITIGRFTSEEAAGLAYNNYASKYFGRFAKLNEISENIDLNKYKPKSNNSSKYKGVSWNKRYEKWKAEIYYNGKQHFLGLFETEILAGLAYNKAVVDSNLDRKTNNIEFEEVEFLDEVSRDGFGSTGTK